jgi:hypothetical protein
VNGLKSRVSGLLLLEIGRASIAVGTSVTQLYAPSLLM